ncbi:IclR-like helix-turn-helix domain-containing protein [Lentzea atacamensis]|uniref:IclR-like helix-turn-helix domain-containing protein n=1 Tax=Lentzea atacamensis TaxID=531938 RepID=A0A316HMH8_9PSEU|nr:helix-turn-helix domain-containing protein [Lentzea atacamensis]PWK82431.1 IclR-like helix-turn-helix domain-containing protein [Lentzea atacamensis]
MGRSVLEGAFSLLDKLMDEGELGLTQLADRCEMPKTTVHRLPDQMEVLGAVENVRGRYRIGARMFRLGQSWEPVPGIMRVARQPLRALSATIRTSTILAVPRRDRVLVAAASIVRAEDVARLRPGATVPAGMEFRQRSGAHGDQQRRRHRLRGARQRPQRHRSEGGGGARRTGDQRGPRELIGRCDPGV